MPRIDAKTADVYGNSAPTGAKIFRERLMDRFKAHEWVRVINIDNEPFRWQYLPNTAESFEMTPDPMKITYRDDPEVYEILPGESEVLLGENAYVMIEALYKKLIAKKVIANSPDLAPGQARNFNFSDGVAQEQFIDRIYLGKEAPQFGNRPAPTPSATVPVDPRLKSIEQELDEELGLNEPPQSQPRRSAKSL